MMIRNSAIVVTLLTLLFMSCTSEYNQYVEREMAKNIQNDSLFLGLKMGMTRKEFYAHCWELNAQKIISQGEGNQTVRFYIEPDSTQGPEFKKEMLFYGFFDEEDIMRGMDVTMSYTAWAIWNEDFHSTPLMKDLKEMYQHLYPGNDFIDIDVDVLDTPAAVKIDGNREILMYPRGDRFVTVKIRDLNYKLAK